MPRVLLVNDDGPPSPSSPHILGFYHAIKALGWDVKVCLPSTQKSWGGMGFSLGAPVAVWYYYPIKDNIDGSHPDTAGSWSATRRPLGDNEVDEWVLVDGSPTTATNIGLFSNVFGEEDDSAKQFDLVISGPNFGRNTGTAFCMSSGTLGAALSAALSSVPSLSISYGHFQKLPDHLAAGEPAFLAKWPQLAVASTPVAGDRAKGDGCVLPTNTSPSSGPSSTTLAHSAHILCASIASRLLAEWEPQVQTYSINVPLAYTLLLDDPQIWWTSVWRNHYGRLFRTPSSRTTSPEPVPHHPASAPPPVQRLTFGPDMTPLLNPTHPAPPGSDIWALQHGFVSVSKLRAAYEEVTVDAAETQVAEASHSDVELAGEVGEARRWRL